MKIVSFDGCGWLFPFHYGVAAYIQDTQDYGTMDFAGISAGATVAAGLATNVPIKKVFEDAIRMYGKNPFKMSRSINIILQKHANHDDDVWKSVSGRLHIGLSKGHFAWNKKDSCTVSEFQGREHVIDVIRASSHLPYLSGLRGHVVDGVRHFDGGLTSTFAQVRGDTRVIHVSPWSNSIEDWIGSDIGFPQIWAFIPRDFESLTDLYDLGYMKAKYFFEKQDNTRALTDKFIKHGAFEVATRFNPITGAPVPKYDFFKNGLFRRNLNLGV